MSFREKYVRYWINFAVFHSSMYLIYDRLKLETINSIKKISIIQLNRQFFSKYKYLIKRGQRVDENNLRLDKCNDVKTLNKQDEIVVNRRTRLPKFGEWVRFYYFLTIVFYFVLFFLHAIICLLNFRIFSSLRYLDCYLPGRFLIGSRVTDGSKFIALVMCIYQLTGRITFFLMKPDFELFCVEFLMFNYNEVLMWEIRLASCERDLERDQGDDNKFDRVIAKIGGGKTNYNSENNNKFDNIEFNYLYNSIVSFRSKFLNDGSRGLILRPNRTIKSWRFLINTSFCYILSASLIVIIFIPSILYMLAPIILTRSGFELNYPNCVSWIGQQSNPLDYAHIYTIRESMQTNVTTASNIMKPQHSVPFLLPFVDFQPFNTYNTVRASIDSVINIICWLDLCCAYSIQLYLAILVMLDMSIYASKLAARLRKLVSSWHRTSLLRHKLISCLNSDETVQHEHYHTSVHIGDSPWQSTSSQHCEVAEIQALILDYFSLISKYNSFVALMILFSTMMWIIYSSSICFWFMIPNTNGQQSVNAEFVILLGWATLLIVFIIGPAALLCSTSCQIYSLVAAAMALDDNYLSTKARWASILKFYYPVPLYCFTLFKKVAISFLFCLKVRCDQLMELGGQSATIFDSISFGPHC